MAGSAVFQERASFACWMNACCGLPVPRPELLCRSRSGRWALRALGALTELVAWLLTLFLGVKLVSPGTSAEERCIGVFTTMTSVKCVAESLHMWLARRRFHRLVALWEAAGEFDVAHDRELSKVRLVSVCIAVTTVTPAIVYCLMPVIPGIREVLGRRHSVPAWFFFDTASSPGFEASVVFQSAAAALTVARIAAFDCFFLSLAGLHVARLGGLRRDLKAVFADLGPAADVTACLQSWIVRHQRATEFGVELQKLYSPMWVVQFLCSLLILCFTAFVGIVVSLSVLPYVLLVGYASGNLVMLYLLCHCGDRLQEASVLVSREAHAEPWYLCGGDVRTSLRIVLQHCGRPLRLTAMGVVPLSSETFESVAKTAVSYFMVLWKLHTEGDDTGA